MTMKYHEVQLLFAIVYALRCESLLILGLESSRFVGIIREQLTTQLVKMSRVEGTVGSRVVPYMTDS